MGHGFFAFKAYVAKITTSNLTRRCADSITRRELCWIFKTIFILCLFWNISLASERLRPFLTGRQQLLHLATQTSVHYHALRSAGSSTKFEISQHNLPFIGAQAHGLALLPMAKCKVSSL